jgi:2-polyprenyl-6-methoxyphenol hydroxylase-like FAD-dependent oxidoreductase
VTSNTTARCCIAGGGPAGMMLGLLLARAGVEVLVLEKHADFLRDFRGDTIHPSTLELMHELGLLEQFLALPHEKVYELRARFGNAEGVIADFRHLATRCGFVAFMPQWDFLNFLARHAAVYPTFRLQMRVEATDLIRDGDRVVGLSATTPEGPMRVRAGLVVAADGRHSELREWAGLPPKRMARPWTCSGFACRAGRTTPLRPWAASTPDASAAAGGSFAALPCCLRPPVPAPTGPRYGSGGGRRSGRPPTAALHECRDHRRQHDERTGIRDHARAGQTRSANPRTPLGTRPRTACGRRRAARPTLGIGHVDELVDRR